MAEAQYVNIVGIQFRRAGKIYDFLAGDHDPLVGDDVVVETERGPSLAKVAAVKFLRSDVQNQDKLKPILRIASRKDLRVDSKLSNEKAITVTRDKVKQLKLNMRILSTDIQFGGNKVIIYFSAPGRVDFRDLVKELAGALRARVELKQVGARDETKILGGMGICGREYCCSSFLRDFVPVSIKMAKNQNLALNPTKVSGGCGRLLCCLNYENETYSEIRKIMPPRGAKVKFHDGEIGMVVKADFLNQQVIVENEQGQEVSLKAQEVEVVSDLGGASERSGYEDDWENLDLKGLED